MEEAELPLSSVFSYLFLHEELHSPSVFKTALFITSYGFVNQKFSQTLGGQFICFILLYLASSCDVPAEAKLIWRKHLSLTPMLSTLVESLLMWASREHAG